MIDERDECIIIGLIYSSLEYSEVIGDEAGDGGSDDGNALDPLIDVDGDGNLVEHDGGVVLGAGVVDEDGGPVEDDNNTNATGTFTDGTNMTCSDGTGLVITITTDGDTPALLETETVTTSGSGYNTSSTCDITEAQLEAAIAGTDFDDDASFTIGAINDLKGIASIVDTEDGKTDNSFDWNIRASALTIGTDYYVYANIKAGEESMVVQLKSDDAFTDGTTADNIVFQSTHGSTLFPMTPVAGDAFDLNVEDEYEFKWEAFDQDETNTGKVSIFISKIQGLVTDADAEHPNSADDDGFWITSDVGQLDNDLADAADGSYTLDVSNLTTSMDGSTPVTPEGEYYVYYYYISDGTAGSQTPIIADGTLNFTGTAGTALAEGFGFSPSKAVVGLGDTLTLNVKLETAEDETNLISLAVNVPSAYFDVVDQYACDENTGADDDASEAACCTENGGTWAWGEDSDGIDNDEDDEIDEVFEACTGGTKDWYPGVNPFKDSDAFGNVGGGINFVHDEMITSGSNYSLQFVQESNDIDVGEDLSDGFVIASFQVVPIVETTEDTLHPQIIDFAYSGSARTSHFNLDGDDIDVEDEDATIDTAYVYFAPPGGVEGYITLEGYDENSGQTATVSLVSLGSNERVYGGSVTLGTDGYYSVSSVATGTYDVLVSRDGFLTAKSDEIDVYPFRTARGDYTLYTGDVVGYTDASGNDVPDNNIDIDDVAEIKTAFGADTSSSVWNVYADANGDGTVHVDDLNYAMKNQDAGSGLVHKTPSIDTDNSNAMISMDILETGSDRVVFGISADQIGSVRAYEVEMDIDATSYEVVSYSDQMVSHGATYNFVKNDGHRYTFVSVLYGTGSIVSESQDLMQLELRIVGSDSPEQPVINSVTLIDGNHSSVKAVINNNYAGLPLEFSLSQNFPNPFNPMTNIAFALPQEGLVNLAIYDLMGREVKNLVSSRLMGGNYTANWNATNESGSKVSTGIYFYSLTVDDKMISSHKMILMK